jgi:hypothetical protein
MKTFLLMVGSAFLGALLFAVGVYFYFFWHVTHLPAGGEFRFPPKSEGRTVSVAPPIADSETFYGSHGFFTGGFSPASEHEVLAAGPGRIAGAVTSNGKPLQGLRLRLALNGSVFSQWTASDADGRYEVPLPYGKYRIDGYELDSASSQRLLAGKTDGPRQGYGEVEVILVEAGKPARGIDLAFVEPVRKSGPVGEVSLAKPVVLTWQPYPGAAAYRLQLIEQPDPRDYESQRRLFDWRERPVVAGTDFDLAQHKVALKKGSYYTLEIEALDERKRTLSQTVRRFDRADFRAIE